MIANIFYTILGIILLGLVADAVYSFTKVAGTLKERLLAIGKTSLTIAVARLGAIAGLGLEWLVWLADLLGSPAVSSALTQYVNSKAVGYTLAFSAIVVEWSRRRTLLVVKYEPANIFDAEVVKAPLVGVVKEPTVEQ